MIVLLKAEIWGKKKKKFHLLKNQNRNEKRAQNKYQIPDHKPKNFQKRTKKKDFDHG